MNPIDATLAPHVEGLSLRQQRMKLIASNIANVDTPGYKARDLAFGETLREAGGAPAHRRIDGRLRTTDARHLGGGDAMATRARIMYRVPEQASLDGNTVDKDLEQSRFAENAMRYQASLQFFGSRVKSLVRALQGE